jgi:hypothetical protein
MHNDAPAAIKPRRQFHPYIKSFFVEEASVAKIGSDIEEESEVEVFLEEESDSENQKLEVDVGL